MRSGLGVRRRLGAPPRPASPRTLLARAVAGPPGRLGASTELGATA